MTAETQVPSDVKNFLSRVAKASQDHNRESAWFHDYSKWVEQKFLPYASKSMKADKSFDLGEISNIKLPWVSFGAINSGHLFGLNEMILFAFYHANRSRYSRFLDLGANIGLHSLVACRIGFFATCVEPDPEHVRILRSNFHRNQETNFAVIEGAATSEDGTFVFTRVEGNTTGSHLKGAKPNPYGALKDFEVQGYAVETLVSNHDLVKMDVEGLEDVLLPRLFRDGFKGYDVIAEIGSKTAAKTTWEEATAAGINVFSQKLGWTLASGPDDLPHHHSEGSVFLSRRDQMHWG